MASRYLRATGNWNGPVWAATSGGAAGSAATPTIDDDVYVAANYTVTVTANASCNSLTHTNGTINLSNYYKLTSRIAFVSSGSASRTINLNEGHLYIPEAIAGGSANFSLEGSNLNFNAGDSTITLNYWGGFDGPPLFEGYFNTSSKTFNDVIINIDTSNGYENSPLNITGSPTFRSLIIQSKNNQAHTVVFDNGSSITADKLVAIGSSVSNKLTLRYATEFSTSTWFSATNKGTVYGQNLALDGFSAVGSPTVPHYIGSNSTVGYSAGSQVWLLQDPPKISTLVDPLTTAPGSNLNWTITGTVTQVTSGIGGGGYQFAGDSMIVSAGTYDLLDSEIILEIPATVKPSNVDYNAYFGISIGSPESIGSFIGEALDSGLEGVFAPIGIGNSGIAAPSIHAVLPDRIYDDDYSDFTMWTFTSLPTTSTRYIKVSGNLAQERLEIRYSSDGITFGSPANVYFDAFSLGATASEMYKYFLRTSRIVFSRGYSNDFQPTIGSINILPNLSPTVTLNTPANNANTSNNPSFTFTGTDPEGNQLTYQIQIDTVNTFDSQEGS